MAFVSDLVPTICVVPRTAIHPLFVHFSVLVTSFRLLGLVVMASATRTEVPGFESRWRRDFSGSSHASDLNIGTPVATLPLPCQAPDVIGSVLGLVGPVSVYGDWVR